MSGASLPPRALVVPVLHGGDDDVVRARRIAGAQRQLGRERVELPRGETAPQTAARMQSEGARELLVIGGPRDGKALAILLEALREAGIAAAPFAPEVESARDDELGAAAAASATADAATRAQRLLARLGVDPVAEVYAGRHLRERNAECLVNVL